MLKTHFYFLMVLVGLASFLAPLHGEETLEDSALAELDPVAIPAKENEEALIQNEEIPERDKDKINVIHRDRRLFASELSTISNAVPDISDGKGNTANPVFHTQQAISQALDQCDGIAVMVGHRNILLPIMKEQGKTAPLAKRILEAVQKNAGVELFILGDDFLIKTPQTEFENPDYTIANQFVGKILNTAPSSTNPLASTPRVIILETSPEMDRSETIRQAIQDLEREVKVSREPVLKEGVPTPFLAELRMQSDIPTKVVQELIKELQAHGVTHFALKAANEGENRILITCPADVSWRKVRTLQEEFKDYNVDVRIAGSDEPVQAVTVGEPLVASDEQAEYRPVLSNPKITLPKVQVRFLGPMGMSVAVQDQTEPFQVPFRHNFVQGRIHPLKFFNIPGRTGLELFPTLELRSPLTVFGSQQDASSVNRYLEHNALAVQITDADLDQAIANNFVTKVLYLPKPDAGGAIANQSEIVSARLEPGVDPVAEAEKRGTVLAVLRIGNRTHHQPVEPTAAESPISDGPMPPVPMPEPYVEPPIKISMTNPEKADDHLKNLLASIEKQHQVTLVPAVEDDGPRVTLGYRAGEVDSLTARIQDLRSLNIKFLRAEIWCEEPPGGYYDLVVRNDHKLPLSDRQKIHEYVRSHPWFSSGFIYHQHGLNVFQTGPRETGNDPVYPQSAPEVPDPYRAPVQEPTEIIILQPVFEDKGEMGRTKAFVESIANQVRVTLEEWEPSVVKDGHALVTLILHSPEDESNVVQLFKRLQTLRLSKVRFIVRVKDKASDSDKMILENPAQLTNRDVTQAWSYLLRQPGFEFHAPFGNVVQSSPSDSETPALFEGEQSTVPPFPSEDPGPFRSGGFGGAWSFSSSVLGIPESAIPGKNYVAGASCIIAISDDGQTASAYSRRHPKWVPVRLTGLKGPKPQIVMGNQLGVVWLGIRYYAYSEQLGTWDVLRLPEGEGPPPTVTSDSIHVTSPTEGDYTFQSDWGKWFSADEIKAGKVEEHLALLPGTAQNGDDDTNLSFKIYRLSSLRAQSASKLIEQLLKPGHPELTLAVEEQTNSLIVQGPPNVQEVVEALIQNLDTPQDHESGSGPGVNVPSPQRNQGTPIGLPGPAHIPLGKPADLARPGPISIDIPAMGRANSDGSQRTFSFYVGVVDGQTTSQLRDNYAQIEKACRDLAKKVNGPHPNPAAGDRFREQLRTKVREAFETRQKLQRAEVAEMAQRLQKIQESIAIRERIADQIVDHRVKELLDPALEWEPNGEELPASSTPSSPHSSATRLVPEPVPNDSVSRPWTKEQAGSDPATRFWKSPSELHDHLHELDKEIRLVPEIIQSVEKQIDEWKEAQERAEPGSEHHRTAMGFVDSLTKRIRDQEQRLEEFQRQQHLAALEYGHYELMLNSQLEQLKQRLETASNNVKSTEREVETGYKPRAALATAQTELRSLEASIVATESLIELYRQSVEGLLPRPEMNSNAPANPFAQPDDESSLTPTYEDSSGNAAAESVPAAPLPKDPVDDPFGGPETWRSDRNERSPWKSPSEMHDLLTRLRNEQLRVESDLANAHAVLAKAEKSLTETETGTSAHQAGQNLVASQRSVIKKLQELSQEWKAKSDFAVAEYKARLETLKADVARDQARLDAANDALERTQKLHQQGAVSRSQVQKVQVEQSSAAAALKQSEALRNLYQKAGDLPINETDQSSDAKSENSRNMQFQVLRRVDEQTVEIDAGAVDRLQVHQVLLVVEKHSSEWPVRSVWLEGVGRVRVTELKVKTAIAQIESEDSQSKIRKGDVVVALPVSKRLSSREPTTSNDHAGVLISLLLDHDQYSEDQLKANVNRTGIEIHTSEEDAPLAPFDDPQIIENCELISFKEVERDGTPFWSVTLAVPQTEENSEANRELTQQRIDDLVAAGTTFLLKNLQSAKGSIRSL